MDRRCTDFCGSGFSRELWIFSFPFKGKAGTGMGFVRDPSEPIPTQTRPARCSAPGVRMACAAVPRKQATLTPLKGRACKGSRLKPLLQVLALLLVLFASPAFAEVRAWLDRDRIGDGETATLNIETDQATVDAPDYSPLFGTFEVTGNTSSRQFESVNGVARTRVLFAVALRPLRDGVLQIPSLQVGNQRTQPLTLTVTAAAPTPTRAGGVVFIESSADATAPYVQQAVGYTVRLYYATSLISGQLDQDPPQGASLQRVGEDLQYQRELSGRRYTVVERRYLLIPERSGAITIPGARFRGQGVGGFFDDLFGDGRQELNARGAPRTLNVRAVPANAPQPWLPLRGLSLQYVSTPQAARAGAAASVTVEARADGASATQLPELQLPPVDGAQVFAEPPQIEETFEQGRPQVRVVRKFSLVPARAGTLRVPGPRMAWWDVGAGAARTASLPDIAIDVAPGANGQTSAPAASTSAAGPAQRWIRVPFVQGAVHAWALGTVVFALLWLATLWWGLHRRPQAAAGAEAAKADASGKQADKPIPNLKQALASGDLAAIAEALCATATPSAADLDGVRAALDDASQQDAVMALQEARWGRGDPVSALASMREAFARGPRWKRARRSEKSLLPPLYPRRRDT